jgi:predicted GIY-YIG superfamily endonuclease
MTGSDEIEYAGHPDRFALYRLYDANGGLLYVGVTDNLKVRLATHAKAKPWWPSVVRKTVAWHVTRTSALTAEAAAIRAEVPLHNIVYGTAPAIAGGVGNDLHALKLTAFRLAPALLARLKTTADQRGETMTDIVSRGVTAELDRLDQAGPSPPRPRRDTAAGLRGTVTDRGQDSVHGNATFERACP